MYYPILLVGVTNEYVGKGASDVNSYSKQLICLPTNKSKSLSSMTAMLSFICRHFNLQIDLKAREASLAKPTSKTISTCSTRGNKIITPKYLCTSSVLKIFGTAFERTHRSL